MKITKAILIFFSITTILLCSIGPDKDSKITIFNRFSETQDIFYTGSTTEISWDSSNTESTIDLILVKNGKVYGKIAKDLPSSKELYKWKTGELEGFTIEKGDNFYIKVEGSSYSSKLFSIIHGAFIEVEDSTRLIRLGNIMPVKWRSSMLNGTLNIQLKSGKGELYTIALKIPVENFIFLWDTSKVLYKDLKPGRYKLIISSSSTDLSTQTEFITILKSKPLSIISPKSGSIFHVGDEIPITWKSTEKTPVKIELLKKGTRNRLLAKHMGTGKQYFLWTSTRAEAGKNYRIKLTNPKGDTAYSQEFDIYPPRTIQILPLHSSVSYQQELRLKWKTTGIKRSVNLELLENGKHVGWIARKVKEKVWFWKAGNIMESKPLSKGTNLKVKITSNETDIYAETLPFEIHKGPMLNITYPTKTTTWTSTSRRRISWFTNIKGPIKISLLKEDGSQRVIAKDVDSTRREYIVPVKFLKNLKNTGRFQISIESPTTNFVTLSRKEILIPEEKTFHYKINNPNPLWKRLSNLIKRKNSLKTGSSKKKAIEDQISETLKKYGKSTGNSNYADYMEVMARNIEQNCFNCITGSSFNIPHGYPEILINKDSKGKLSLKIFRRAPGSTFRFQEFKSFFSDIQKSLPFDKSSLIPFSKRIFPIYTAELLYSSEEVKDTVSIIGANRTGEDNHIPEVVIFRNIVEKLFNTTIEPLAKRCFHSSLANNISPQNLIDLIALKRMCHFAGPLPVYYNEKEKEVDSIDKKTGVSLFHLERMKSSLAAITATKVLMSKKVITPEEYYGINVTWLTSMMRNLRNRKNMDLPLNNSDLYTLLKMEKSKILKEDKSSSTIVVNFAELGQFISNNLKATFTIMGSKKPEVRPLSSPLPSKLKDFINKIDSVPGYINFKYSMKRKKSK